MPNRPDPHDDPSQTRTAPSTSRSSPAHSTHHPRPRLSTDLAAPDHSTFRDQSSLDDLTCQAHSGPIDEPSLADTLPHDLPPRPNPFPSTYLSDPSRSTVDWSALASSFDLPFPAVPNPIDNPAPSSPFDWTHPATPIRSTTLLPPAHETCRSDSVLYDGPNPATPTDPIHPAHLDKPRRTNLTFPTCSDHVTTLSTPLDIPRGTFSWTHPASSRLPPR